MVWHGGSGVRENGPAMDGSSVGVLLRFSTGNGNDFDISTRTLRQGWDRVTIMVKAPMC